MSILIQRETENIELKLPELTYIYRFCSPTGKSYVGQTKNIPRRISQHLDGEGSKSLLRDLVEFGQHRLSPSLTFLGSSPVRS